MGYFLNILFIAIALSMDTFSLSLGLGTYHITKKKSLYLSLMVGLMHFIMPFLGDMLGEKLVSFFSLNSHFLLGCILLFIAINLIIEMFKEKDVSEIHFSFLEVFLFSFGVSIDAFSTGIGLSALTENKVFAMIIFSLVSFMFTFGGLMVGRFASQKLGKKAEWFGVFLLLVLGLSHLCK